MQIESNVVNVITESSHDFSKMLNEVTPSKKKTPSILALDFRHETSKPSNSDVRSQPKETTNQKLFDKSRNFR